MGPANVLITGCSSGIGRATAEHLVDRGWKVYATARRPDTLADLGQRGAEVLALDVTDEASMEAAVATVEERDGHVAALVNNAGYSLTGPVEEADPEAVRRQFETNVFGLVRLTQLVLPGMRRAGEGRIVNVSSMGGRMTLPAGGLYHGTKYAVEAISDALRYEVRPFGVRVVLVEPSAVVTGFADAAIATMPGADDDADAPVAAGPYAQFNAAVAKIYTDSFEKPRPGGAIPATKVARTIERALTTRRPKPRYLVGAQARSLVGARRLLGTRGFDMVLRSQFPSPEPEAEPS